SGNKSGYFINWATQVKFGYRIYKGNARNTPITSLLPMGNCDSMMTNGYNAAYRMFKCSELETNTTYSIQIFAHEDFYNDIRLGIAVGGTTPTQSPTPVLTASNDFGTLISTPNGTTSTRTDFLACNSRMATSSCGTVLPSEGVVFNGNKYNLSTFFTFTLTTASTVDFNASSTTPTSCGPRLIFRVFQQGLTANCADLDMANLIGTY